MAVQPSRSATASPPVRRGSDSPWFWAYLFGAGALAALLLAGPKYQVRQAHVEREYQGRARAAQNLSGQAPSVSMSAPGDPLIGLRPLLLFLGAATALAWAAYWWSARQAPRREAPAGGGAQPPAAGAAP